MISFVLPAHNEERHLAGTLTALHAAAQEASEPYEIIVVDDASTDATATVAARHGARVVPVTRRQISAVRNAGAAVAQGDLLIFVDADTIVPGAVVRAALDAVRAGAVGGGARARFDGGLPLYGRVLWRSWNLLQRLGDLAAGCFIFATRQAFKAAGGFDETLYAAEDVALSRTLARAGKFVIVPETVTTSGRSLRTYSSLEALWIVGGFLLRGPKFFRTRTGPWYQRRRDDVDPVPPARQPPALTLVGAVVAAKLALHLAALAVTRFGIQRDEFLYLAMGRHLRFWRMDFPPMIAVLGNLSGAIFGHSLAAVRVFPALEGSLIVVVAALIARELGGGRFAQLLTAVCMLGSVLFFRSATLFQPTVLDQLWWTVALYTLVRLGRENQPRRWMALGLALGVGLLTKFSILFLGLSIFVAIVITPMRRSLLTPWPWLAAAVALAVGSPSITGQIALHFPLVAQMQDLEGRQLAHVTWGLFLTSQPLMVGPVPFLLAALGAGGLIWWRPWRPFAVVGWTCVSAFLLLFLLRGKAYYIGPVYPALCAAGSVLLERLRPGRWTVPLRAGAAGGALVFGLVTLPIGIPILSPEATAAFAARVGATASLRTNQGVMDRLPQDYADMLGWEEQARALARALAGLTPAERDSAVIFGGNYGEASAAEFYGPRYGLPPVVCASGSYWFFGPGERAGTVLITIGEDSSDVAKAYDDVRPVETVSSPWSVEEERVVPVIVARRPKQTLQQLWPSLAGRN